MSAGVGFSTEQSSLNSRISAASSNKQINTINRGQVQVNNGYHETPRGGGKQSEDVYKYDNFPSQTIQPPRHDSHSSLNTTEHLVSTSFNPALRTSICGGSRLPVLNHQANKNYSSGIKSIIIPHDSCTI